MDWSDEEVSDTVNRTKGLPYSLAGVTVRAIMTRAVSLFLARASGQVKEDARKVRAVLDNVHAGSMTTHVMAADARDAHARLSALAQEAESLRAKVAEETARADTLHRTWQRAEQEITALRVEVKRLKANEHGLQNALQIEREHHAAVQVGLATAESRLAAIRERVSKARGHFAAVYAHYSAAEIERANPTGQLWHWREGMKVLEGDAPQEATYLDVDLVCGRCATWVPHRWMPSPDAGPGWRCSQCSTLSTDSRRPQEAGDDRPYPQRVPHEFVPIGDTPKHCGALTASGNRCGWFVEQHRWPCSERCTHDDAATPGHPERVSQRSEAVIAASNANTGHPDALPEGPLEVVDPAFIAGHEQGAEAMRAAVITLIARRSFDFGLSPWQRQTLKAAIEGVVP